MHERERHRLILSAVQARPVATVQEIAGLTGASEATIRRDFSLLADQQRLRKVRQKQAIAKAAVALCGNGDAVIINGGTTTFQMVHGLSAMRLEVLTNSFPIAGHLAKHSKCDVLLPAGRIYREQGLVLSPFVDDGIAHFRARRMFMGAQGVSAFGFAEADPLIVQSEQRLMNQADELVMMVDSTKFGNRSSMIVAPLGRAAVVVTDDAIRDVDVAMLEAAGVRVIVAGGEAETEEGNADAV